jgi:hypothetical protein
LKSTSAVAQYLERIAGETHELGAEGLRYYDLAQADLETANEPTTVELFGRSGLRARFPVLPLAPAGHERPDSELVVRGILEDLARARSDVPEPYRLQYLAVLDSILVAGRQELGGFLLRAMQEVDLSLTDETDWRFRTIMLPGPPEPPSLQLGFGVCSREHGEEIVGVFQGWVELRR